MAGNLLLVFIKLLFFVEVKQQITAGSCGKSMHTVTIPLYIYKKWMNNFALNL